MTRKPFRFIDMTLKDLIRASIHFPVGVFTAWLATQSPILTLVFGVGFLTYEVSEDWRIEDHSFKDIFGYLVGIGAGAMVFFALGG